MLDEDKATGDRIKFTDHRSIKVWRDFHTNGNLLSRKNQPVAPLSTTWKKVVASRTSIGTEISGSTNSFFPLPADSPLVVFSTCFAGCSPLRISFCLAKANRLLRSFLSVMT